MTTTPASIAPHLARYRAIHGAQRVDTARYVAALGAVEHDETRRRHALGRWAAGFAHELTLHHTVEDEVFFPALARRAGGLQLTLARLDADHHRVEGLIERLVATGGRVAHGPFAPARREAHAVAVELRDLLRAHLDLEDDEVLPAFGAHFDGDEFAALEREALGSLPKQGLAFSIPWNIAALPADQRDATLAGAPRALRLLHRATKGRYARLVATAFAGVTVDGPAPAPVPAPAPLVALAS